MTLEQSRIQALVLTLPGDAGYDLEAIDIIARHWTFVREWLEWSTGWAIRSRAVMEFVEAPWSFEERQFPGLFDLVDNFLFTEGIAIVGNTYLCLVQGAPLQGWARHVGISSFGFGLGIAGDNGLGPLLEVGGRPELNFRCRQAPPADWGHCNYHSALNVWVHEIGHAAFALDHADRPGDPPIPNVMTGYLLSPGSSDTPKFIDRHIDQMGTSPYVFARSTINMPFPLLPGMRQQMFFPGQRVRLPSSSIARKVIDGPTPVIAEGSVYWGTQLRTWLYSFPLETPIGIDDSIAYIEEDLSLA